MAQHTRKILMTRASSEAGGFWQGLIDGGESSINTSYGASTLFSYDSSDNTQLWQSGSVASVDSVGIRWFHRASVSGATAGYNFLYHTEAGNSTVHSTWADGESIPERDGYATMETDCIALADNTLTTAAALESVRGGFLLGLWVRANGGTVYMKDVNVWVTYTLKDYTVTATAQTGGTVTGTYTDTEGATNSFVSGESYEHGGTIVLRARKLPGFSFTGWNDGVTAVSRQISVSDTVRLTAMFSPDEQVKHNPYETRFGADFFPPTADIYTSVGDLYPLRYSTFLNPFSEIGDDLITYHDWRLYPVGRIEIEPPTPNIQLLDVPGSDTPIDLTEVLTGRPLFSTRKGKWDFKIVQPRCEWDSIYSEVMNALHGRRFKVVRMEELDYYYSGRISITSTDSDKYNGRVKMEGVYEPFKYSVQTTDEDWLWDPFSFEDGIVYDNPNDYSEGFSLPERYAITIPPGGTTRLILGSDMVSPTSPAFIVEKDSSQTLTLTVAGTSTVITLENGRNEIPGLYCSTSNLRSMTFSLSSPSSDAEASVLISYRRSSL